jgi:hypothetical protein
MMTEAESGVGERAHLAVNRFYARRVDRTPDSIRDLQQRCAALDTWCRWADDATIDELEVGAVIDTLLNATALGAHHCRAVGELILPGANRNGIHVPTQQPPGLRREIVGPDLGR